MKQKAFIGINALHHLELIIKENNYNNIFLVTNNQSYISSRNKEIMDEVFHNCHCLVYRFYNFTPNPQIEDLTNGINAFNKENFDAIVSVGGGSALDIAKLINVFSMEKNEPAFYIKGKLPLKQKAKPLIAIPTTSGSGAEATHFAVLYMNKTKYSIASTQMLPDVVIIDPVFTANLPPYITAYTGMDAFSQAVESIWSIHSNKESLSFASKAILLIMQHIEKAVHNPNVKSRSAMAKAAYYAGKAINITKTTAPHAFSYPITSYYNIPHGHAVSLTLPYFLEYNYEVHEKNLNDQRGIEHVQQSIKKICQLVKASDIKQAKSIIYQLMRTINLETNFTKLGIIDLKLIADHINAERLANNPRKISDQDVIKLLTDISLQG